MPNPRALRNIDSDPALAGTKLIAEAWDAAGLYQVGSFAGEKWREWNGRFRDDMRSFFRRDGGFVCALADRLFGSPQIYAHKGREAEESINFVACHDGFTLNDLVSYNTKHNEANGENNRDGADDDRSHNLGVEGPTDNSAIEKLRNRLVKNFLTATMVSLGLPMLLMGDEVRRTQNGNNNAYCQDNETSWFDWTLTAKHPDVLRFASVLCAQRLLADVDSGNQRLTLNQLLGRGNRLWHGVKLGKPDWSFDSHSLAASIDCADRKLNMYMILNAYWEPLEFELPEVSDNYEPWCRTIDTSLDSPNDIVDRSIAPMVGTRSYLAAPYSVVTLFSRAKNSISIGV